MCIVLYAHHKYIFLSREWVVGMWPRKKCVFDTTYFRMVEMRLDYEYFSDERKSEIYVSRGYADASMPNWPYT